MKFIRNDSVNDQTIELFHRIKRFEKNVLRKSSEFSGSHKLKCPLRFQQDGLKGSTTWRILHKNSAL